VHIKAHYLVRAKFYLRRSHRRNALRLDEYRARRRVQVCRPEVASCCRAARASGIVVCFWGIGAPAHDLGTVLDEADVREEFIMRQGLIPVRSPPPDELRRFVAGEIVRLGDIVRKTGLAGSE
jgi:hypothetical protein